MSELRIVKFSEMTLIKLGLRNDKLYFKDEADKAIAHQKYKRCLVMAKWCCLMYRIMLNEAHDDGTSFKESRYWKRASWYGKWKRKWLELAKQFSKGESRC